MSFEEPNDQRSSKIGNHQIQLTELVTYEERAPASAACGRIGSSLIGPFKLETLRLAAH